MKRHSSNLVCTSRILENVLQKPKNTGRWAERFQYFPLGEVYFLVGRSPDSAKLFATKIYGVSEDCGPSHHEILNMSRVQTG